MHGKSTVPDKASKGKNRGKAGRVVHQCIPTLIKPSPRVPTTAGSSREQHWALSFWKESSVTLPKPSVAALRW